VEAARTGRAMVLGGPGRSLALEQRAIAEPGPGEVLVRVRACGVCRTDLHLLDGELEAARYPIVPGHQIVGQIAARGAGVEGLALGQRVGIPWLGWTCGECSACRGGDENLCARALFAGCQRDGGFADHARADARYCFPLPERYGDVEIAPLLCAGLIGFRAARLAGDVERVGLYGFGAAAHLVAQVLRARGQRVFAFTRPGDASAQAFARSLGAEWAGASDGPAPELLDAALLFAPVGALVPLALQAVRPGGAVICAGIHMSDIPAFPYRWLWGERSIRSVANLTRRDAREFLELAARIDLRTSVHAFPLAQANAALAALRDGSLQGAAVLDLTLA
jgi:alcohol dehydrogenase, propanol-preferring